MEENKDTYRIAIKVEEGEWMLIIQSFKSAEKARNFAAWNYRNEYKEGENFIIIKIFNGELDAIDFDDFPLDWKN